MCSHIFELKQGFDAEPIHECPVCKGESKRRLHSVAVIYKGSGFYTTDYARKNTGGGNTSASSGNHPSGDNTTSEGDRSKSESTGKSNSESAVESKGESKASEPTT